MFIFLPNSSQKVSFNSQTVFKSGHRNFLITSAGSRQITFQSLSNNLCSKQKRPNIVTNGSSILTYNIDWPKVIHNLAWSVDVFWPLNIDDGSAYFTDILLKKHSDQFYCLSFLHQKSFLKTV